MKQIIATTFDSVKSFGQRGRGFGRFLNPVGLTVGKQGDREETWLLTLNHSRFAAFCCCLVDHHECCDTDFDVCR
jgi:hypothetical protein